jgi:hypothetical protein
MKQKFVEGVLYHDEHFFIYNLSLKYQGSDSVE